MCRTQGGQLGDSRVQCSLVLPINIVPAARPGRPKGPGCLGSKYVTD